MRYLVLLSIWLTFSLHASANDVTEFTEQEVIFVSGEDTLFGTLCIPEGRKEVPVALIIAGSGPTDRNGNNPIAGSNNSLQMLAQGLAKEGIASLRYDKRGVAASAESGLDESSLRFDHYVDDAIAACAFLRSGGPYSSLHIVGHSEGALIGLRAAQEVTPDGYVSVSGTAMTADTILMEQLKNASPKFYEESLPIFDSLRAGKLVDDISPLLFSLFRPSVQPYMISWMKYHPLREIRKLEFPVLIINGDSDLQVGEDNAFSLEENAPKKSEVVIISGMNHVLKNTGDELNANIAAYRDPELPLAEGLIQAIVNYIRSRD